MGIGEQYEFEKTGRITDEGDTRTTQEPTMSEQIKKPCFDDCIGMDDFPRVDECLQGTENAQMCSHLSYLGKSTRKGWRSCGCGGKSDLLSQYLGWQKQKQALDLHEMTTKMFKEQADAPTKPMTNTPSNTTHLLKTITELPELIHQFMEENDIVIDSTRDKMQRFALTLYTKIIMLRALVAEIEREKPWTAEPPSVEGWYWCKIADDKLLVRIRLSIANIWCADVHHEDGRVNMYSCALKVKDALWQGPLKPGEEA